VQRLSEPTDERLPLAPVADERRDRLILDIPNEGGVDYEPAAVGRGHGANSAGSYVGSTDWWMPTRRALTADGPWGQSAWAREIHLAGGRSAGGDRDAGDDGGTSMDRRDNLVPAQPLEWQPLVSRRERAIFAGGYSLHREVLEDLRVVLTQPSPRVRSALVANLLTTLTSEERPTRAVWAALAITGNEVKLCSAAALGRLRSDLTPAVGAGDEVVRLRR